MSQQLVASRCDTAAWITLRWTRGSRYYRVHLEQDLWDAWLLTHVNGRIGTPLGRARALPAATLEAALLTLAAVAKRRRQRGYDFSPSHVKAIEGATTMNTISTVLDLLKRQAELEEGLRQPGGNRVTEEREIYALREHLQRYPQAVTAILQAARSLNRPVDTLQPNDVRDLV